MNLFKNIWADLVGKRLWPIAIVLVAALVALPKLLGGGAPADDATAAAVTPLPPITTKTGVIALEGSDGVPTTRVRAGDRTDPFRRQLAKKVQENLSTLPGVNVPTTPATPDPAGGGSTGSSGGGSTGGSTGPSDDAKPAPAKPKSGSKYVVTIAFGKSGDVKTYDDIARLTPLPSADQPWFVYLGLTNTDTKKASFLLSTQADVNGDGACSPSKSRCERVALAEGETQYFDVPSGTGGMTQYELRITKIAKREVSATAAAASVRRESKAGREVLRSLLQSDPSLLDGVSYSMQSGMLEHVAAGRR